MLTRLRFASYIEVNVFSNPSHGRPWNVNGSTGVLKRQRSGIHGCFNLDRSSLMTPVFKSN